MRLRLMLEAPDEAPGPPSRPLTREELDEGLHRTRRALIRGANALHCAPSVEAVDAALAKLDEARRELAIIRHTLVGPPDPF